MARRGLALRRGSGACRQVQWVGLADQGFVAVAGGAKVIVTSFFPEGETPSMVKPTIVRTRGNVLVKPSTGIVTDLNFVGAIGTAIVSKQAFDAGVASVPGPFIDSDWGGWLVWRSFSYSQEVAGTVGNLVLNHMTFEVDSKAMRKMGANDVLVDVAESQGGAFSISMQLRVLAKLS